MLSSIEAAEDAAWHRSAAAGRDRIIAGRGAGGRAAARPPKPMPYLLGGLTLPEAICLASASALRWYCLRIRAGSRVLSLP